jgi:GNAT superfamily N-acetyltransferase
MRLTTQRIYNLDEAPQLAILFDQYRVFYDQKSDLEGAKTYLEERLNNHQSIIIITEDDGELVGFTQLYPSFSSVSMKPLYILNDLFVIKEYRGNGIGQILLKAAGNLGKSLGWKGMVLETHFDNPAQKLYKREGWVLDEDYLHFGKYF